MTQNTSILSFLKFVGYSSAVALFEYLGVPQLQFVGLGILMIVDLISGLAKVYIIDPTKIASHEMWIGVIKKFLTLITLLSGAFVFKLLGFDPRTYIQGVLAILIASEFYSVLQNVYSARTGKVVSEYDVTSLLIMKIGEIIKQMIEGMLNKNISKKEE